MNLKLTCYLAFSHESSCIYNWAWQSCLELGGTIISDVPWTPKHQNIKWSAHGSYPSHQGFDTTLRPSHCLHRASLIQMLCLVFQLGKLDPFLVYVFPHFLPDRHQDGHVLLDTPERPPQRVFCTALDAQKRAEKLCSVRLDNQPVVIDNPWHYWLYEVLLWSRYGIMRRRVCSFTFRDTVECSFHWAELIWIGSAAGK